MSCNISKIIKELNLIQDDLRNHINAKWNVTTDDFDVRIFEQTWGSTALGFIGIGGQMMTSANTYVFIPNYDGENVHVYFSTGYAYSVPYSQVLMEDIGKENMEPQFRAGKYLKAYKEEQLNKGD